MLVSVLLDDFASDTNSELRLSQQSLHLVTTLCGNSSLPAAFFEGLCEEVALLIARMCSPMKAAVEQMCFQSGQTECLAIWIERELRRCPSLDDALSRLVQQLVSEFVLVWNRFSSDRQALIAQRLLRPQDSAVAVRIASADKHHGQHVLKISLSGERALFYKPRPGSGASVLLAASGLLAKWGFTLGAAPTIDFQSHHWMTEVPYEPKQSAAEALVYAYNGGVLYGMATLLNSSDLHFENLIATRGCPVVVDCETLCQPRFSKSAAAHLLKRPHDDTDDASSLFLNLDQYGGQQIDYGGLSCVEIWFRKDPYAGAQVQLLHDDRQLARHTSRSAIEVNGQLMAPAVTHFDTFAEGFKSFCAVAAKHSEELGGLVHRDAVFRIPLRATRVYAALLAERLGEIYFSTYSGRAWRSHLQSELLETEASFSASARAILSLETMELESLDIPVGYVRAGDRDLILGNQVLSGVFDLSPLEMIQRRIGALNSNSVERRVEELRKRVADCKSMVT